LATKQPLVAVVDQKEDLKLPTTSRPVARIL